MSVKNLYIGYFNGRTKMHVERCMAYSEKQAFYVLCQRVAKKYGVPPGVVIDHFRLGENCEIKLEIEFEEEEIENG